MTGEKSYGYYALIVRHSISKDNKIYKSQTYKTFGLHRHPCLPVRNAELAFMPNRRSISWQ